MRFFAHTSRASFPNWICGEVVNLETRTISHRQCVQEHRRRTRETTQSPACLLILPPRCRGHPVNVAVFPAGSWPHGASCRGLAICKATAGMIAPSGRSTPVSTCCLCAEMSESLQPSLGHCESAILSPRRLPRGVQLAAKRKGGEKRKKQKSSPTGVEIRADKNAQLCEART